MAIVLHCLFFVNQRFYKKLYHGTDKVRIMDRNLRCKVLSDIIIIRKKEENYDEGIDIHKDAHLGMCHRII